MLLTVPFNIDEFNKLCDETIKGFNALPELSPRTEEDLISLFGCPKLDVKSPEKIRPPSPSESIVNTQHFLKRLQEKGFVKDIDSESFEKEMIQRRLQAVKNKKKSKAYEEIEQNDLQSLVTQEPYLKFWIQTNTAQNIISEINGLPFKENHLRFLYASHFYNNITSYVRKERPNEPPKKTPQFLHDQMHKFVTECQKQRKELIENAILNNHIDIKHLHSTITDEFHKTIESHDEKEKELLFSENNDVKPKEKAKKEDPPKEQAEASDFVFLQHAKGLIDKFPPSYEMKEDYFKEDFMKQQNEKIVGIINNIPQSIVHPKTSNIVNPTKSRKRSFVCKPKIVVPVTHPKENKNEQMKKTLFFWKTEDPLAAYRGNKDFNIFSQMDSLIDLQFQQEDPSNDCTIFPHLTVEDYLKPTPVITANPSNHEFDGPYLNGVMWNTSQLAKMTQRHKQTQNAEDPSAPKINGFTAQQLIEGASVNCYSEAYQYLITHQPPDLNVIPNPEEVDIVKLEECLKELSYSVYMKLEILKKYSGSTNDMNSIAESISYWIHCIKMLHSFDNCYHDLKDYIVYSKPFSKLDVQFKTLRQNFDQAYKSLDDAANTLKNVGGDVLYIRGHNFGDFLYTKKSNIKRLLYEE